MNRDSWFAPKWKRLKQFAILACIGLLIVVAAMLADMPMLGAFSIILFVPLMFWLVFIPVLHWKDRYLGQRSAVWGAFLVFDTSSWSKLVYWYRHVLPDWRRQGRYVNVE